MKFSHVPPSPCFCLVSQPTNEPTNEPTNNNNKNSTVNAGPVHAAWCGSVRDFSAQVFQAGLRAYGGRVGRKARFFGESSTAALHGIRSPYHGDVHEVVLVSALRSVGQRRARRAHTGTSSRLGVGNPRSAAVVVGEGIWGRVGEGIPVGTCCL